MILDAILLILKNCAGVLLMPLTFIDMAVDFVASIPLVMSFLQVIAYLLPWQNLIPLIAITISIIGFRIVLSIINIVLKIVPFFG